MNKQQTEMKEYLSQAFRIDQRIQSKMEQVASLNDLATRATATYSDMPGSETRNLHRMEDAILSIIELEAEINGDICKLVQTKKDIVHKIKAAPEHGVPDPSGAAVSVFQVLGADRRGHGI